MARKASSLELLLQEERRKRMQSPPAPAPAPAPALSSEAAWAYNHKCVLTRGEKKHLPQGKETWDLGGQAAGLQWIDAYKMPLGLISPTTPPDSLRYASNNRSLLLRASSLLPVGILNEACLGLLCVPQPRDFSPRRRCCLGAVLGRKTMQT
jgi:hypothetical protein